MGYSLSGSFCRAQASISYPSNSDFKLPFLLDTDVSDFAVRGVLGQVQDGKERDNYLSLELSID